MPRIDRAVLSLMRVDGPCSIDAPAGLMALVLWANKAGPSTRKKRADGPVYKALLLLFSIFLARESFYKAQ